VIYVKSLYNCINVKYSYCAYISSDVKTRNLAIASRSRSASYYSPSGWIRQYRNNCCRM